MKVVFDREYELDIKKWIGALRILEEKGYTREEMLDILTAEPPEEWHHVARLLAAKAQTHSAIADRL